MDDRTTSHRIIIQCLSAMLLRYGYLVALQYTMRLKPGALLMCGLPCSLHVWISRGTSGKSRQNPRGNCEGSTAHTCTQKANLIACRFALVALLCMVRCVWWLTEQPSSSVAHWLPYIELALQPARCMLGFTGGLWQRMWHAWNELAFCHCNVSCMGCTTMRRLTL